MGKSKFRLFFFIIIMAVILPSCQKKEKSVSREWELRELLKKEPSNVKVLLELGIYYHNVQKPNEAIEYLNRVLEIKKDDPLGLVYLGSSYTILADKSQRVEDKLAYVEKGTRLLDEAVKKFPENFEVRLVHGINSVCLPPMFGRFRLAIDDFEYLLTKEEKIPKEQLLQILEYLARAYEMDNQFQKATEIKKRLTTLKNDGSH
ncbi:MAG: tetratricopeptide repeat protein [bacterium]